MPPTGCSLSYDSSSPTAWGLGKQVNRRNIATHTECRPGVPPPPPPQWALPPGSPAAHQVPSSAYHLFNTVPLRCSISCKGRELCFMLMLQGCTLLTSLDVTEYCHRNLHWIYIMDAYVKGHVSRCIVLLQEAVHQSIACVLV